MFCVLFLAPVLVASQNGGCSTTQEPGSLSKQQIVKVLAGSTITGKDQKSFAFVGADGTLKGLNTPNGGTTGSWRITNNNLLCAKWN